MRLPAALVLVVLSATLLAVPQAPAPGPQATFRSSVDVVEVDVSVLDRRRLPVRGLTAADFTVLEDGGRRPIVAFSEVELPRRTTPSAPWIEDVAPDVATNAVATEGRLVVVMMDRSITTEHSPTARAVARAAIEQLRPGDLAAVVFSNLGVPQNFTSDRRLLLAAIDRPLLRLPSGDAGSPVSCVCGSCSLETIATVAEGLREVPQRRKVLIVIGPNISVNPMGQCSGALTALRTRTTRALQAANITVHAFDPAGLETLGGSAASPTPPNYQALVSASMRRRGNIAYLPGETGGRVVGGNEPQRGVSEVFRESDAYYVIGFQPAASRLDTRYRRISVKVDRDDTIVQARRGYFGTETRFASSATFPARVPVELGRAVAGVWPRTDLSLTMQAVPMARPGLRDAEVRVTLGVHQEADPRRPGAPPAPLFTQPLSVESAIFIGAFDREGRALADVNQTVMVPVVPRPDRSYRYEVTSQLALKPGRYEIRAAVDDRTLHASGSVYGYVEVPDYAAEPVTISGIFLQAAASAGGASRSTDTALPLVPTTRRVFRADERVTAFVREHQGLTRAMMPGYFNVSIRNATDQRVFGLEQRILPELFGSNRAMDYSFDVPLRDLAPGEYLLTVEARHGNVVVTKDARFRVE